MWRFATVAICLSVSHHLFCFASRFSCPLRFLRCRSWLFFFSAWLGVAAAPCRAISLSLPRSFVRFWFFCFVPLRFFSSSVLFWSFFVFLVSVGARFYPVLGLGFLVLMFVCGFFCCFFFWWLPAKSLDEPEKEIMDGDQMKNNFKWKTTYRNLEIRFLSFIALQTLVDAARWRGLSAVLSAA